MKEYKWNEHGVCINPDVIEIKTNNSDVRIETAEHGGLWYYGYTYHAAKDCRSSLNPCMAKFQKGETIPNNAIVLAIMDIKRHEKPRGDMQKKLMELYFDKAQLLLF